MYQRQNCSLLCFVLFLLISGPALAQKNQDPDKEYKAAAAFLKRAIRSSSIHQRLGAIQRLRRTKDARGCKELRAAIHSVRKKVAKSEKKTGAPSAGTKSSGGQD